MNCHEKQHTKVGESKKGFLDDSVVILGNFSKNNSRIQISPSWLRLGNLVIYPPNLSVVLEKKQNKQSTS